MKININDIRIPLIAEWEPTSIICVKIEEMPHYKFLCGNEQPYVEYITRFPQGRSIEGFRSLIQDFDYAKMGDIICWEAGKTFLVYDGSHRICILFHKGFKEIDVVIKEK